MLLHYILCTEGSTMNYILKLSSFNLLLLLILIGSNFQSSSFNLYAFFKDFFMNNPVEIETRL